MLGVISGYWEMLAAWLTFSNRISYYMHVMQPSYLIVCVQSYHNYEIVPGNDCFEITLVITA